MSWILHVMLMDDDVRVLESHIPSLANEVRKLCERSSKLGGRPRQAGEKALGARIRAHGYESSRLPSQHGQGFHSLEFHMVRETDGGFDVARRLLNQHLFSVVVSDLRFSDQMRGQRAGKLFVEEMARLHPETIGILYSAYPKPDDFPSARFLRKGGDADGGPSLASVIVEQIENHLSEPSIKAFVGAIDKQGLVFESDAFGTTLAQVFRLARLLAGDSANGLAAGGRRPLPCVMLDGESGTGKRGLAAVFHAASDRREGPLVVASCNELTNETLLRSILFGHKRGAFTDAREDRPGLVAAAAKGVLLLDDFHRLPPACAAIVHSFLEDGEYSRMGEEEVRRQAECTLLIAVESGPWRERRRAGDLPAAFFARVERLPVEIPPLRERPEDISAQAQALIRSLSDELGVELVLSDDAIETLRVQAFAESNSRELRNLIEQAVYRHYRETDVITWSHLEPFTVEARFREGVAAAPKPASPVQATTRGGPAPNEWQIRLRQLATKILARGLRIDEAAALPLVDSLFDDTMPRAWPEVEAARTQPSGGPPIPMPIWEDLWRCFAVNWLGGPTPAEKVLGIPANTLRQWINDREAR